jgi:hypothetical protein
MRADFRMDAEIRANYPREFNPRELIRAHLAVAERP